MRSALILSLVATTWSQPVSEYAASDESGEAYSRESSREGSNESSSEIGYIGNYDESAEQAAREASSEFSYHDQDITAPGRQPFVGPGGQSQFPGTQPGFPVLTPGTQGFPVLTPGTQPAFPSGTTQPAFPSGTQPAFPSGTFPSGTFPSGTFPSGTTQPGFPSGTTQPAFPSGTQQPGFPSGTAQQAPLQPVTPYTPTQPYTPASQAAPSTAVAPAAPCPEDSGYLWCAAKQKCLQAWVEPCPQFGTVAQSSAPRTAAGAPLYVDPATGLYTPASNLSPYVPATVNPYATTPSQPAASTATTTPVSSSAAGLYVPKNTIATVIPATGIYANAAAATQGTSLPAFPSISAPVTTPIYSPPLRGPTTILPPAPVITTGLPTLPRTPIAYSPVLPPSTGCICGQPCITTTGSLGVCQTDRRTCAVNILPPNCAAF